MKTDALTDERRRMSGDGDEQDGSDHRVRNGVIAAGAVLLILVAVWFLTRGDHDHDVARAVATGDKQASAQKGVRSSTVHTRQIVAGTVTTVERKASDTASGRSNSNREATKATGNTSGGHSGTGGTSAGTGHHASTSPSSSTAAGSGISASSTAANLSVTGSGLTQSGSVKKVNITSCTKNGNQVRSTGDVTLANGLVIHAVPVDPNAGTVTINGVPLKVPAGVTYGLSSCK